ncbi:MAG: hypothetical protein AB7O65_07925 [Candidatus Korobacteraceae bacterium]
MMLAITLVLPFALAVQGGAADAATSSLTLKELTTRMEHAYIKSKERAPDHILTREFQILNKQNKPYSQVTAEVNFTPPGSKSFRILTTSGSSRGEAIVRRLLETESTTAAESEGEITGENYQFALLGEASLHGKRCYLLKLNARREDTRLVNGQAWVDADTYLIHKVEGEMAKMPSWWLRSVNVTITFAPLGGMWMQTGTTAVAEVRIAGRRTFTSRVVALRMNSGGGLESSRAAVRLQR